MAVGRSREEQKGDEGQDEKYRKEKIKIFGGSTRDLRSC